MEPQLALLRRRYPTLEDLERRARWRLPRFAWDFLQGGAGDETGMPRNRAALRAVQVVPRYGVSVAATDPGADLFGHRYAAPIGIAPVGFDGLFWPGASRQLAMAAQAMNLPYMVGTLATESIETVAALAPDVTWFQLYPLAADNHRVSHDLAQRAERAGARVLAATLDVPARTKRPRDLRNGFTMPFRITPSALLQGAVALPWALAIARRGIPTFANITAYSGPGRDAAAAYVGKHVGGGFDWESLARLRDRWPRAMMVKGVLHPADAEKAVSLGMDGIVVSNHGGRQFDAAPASIDMLPAIVAAVGTRALVMLDSGVTSGADALRALALGAQGVLAGRAFMLALAALGDIGARHMAATLIEELTLAMAQSGATDVRQVASLATRHPGAWPFEALQ